MVGSVWAAAGAPFKVTAASEARPATRQISFFMRQTPEGDTQMARTLQLPCQGECDMQYCFFVIATARYGIYKQAAPAAFLGWNGEKWMKMRQTASSTRPK